ncbi:NAD-dependent dehydratase [bacterium (Candidatus Gribaldobacteria) CG_4_10_14_0_8_um_filter_33_9]|uniref:dTDP-4-dehydrorhamnose reductase n=1 Tax=bacterium (Candidatus Gribaldobacteria) CG_4_10_14_0_8_um_filter_33_9 TaxID=2014266 RepID=A0A2M7RP85_9BACT|nr:MAG: NAD-dependent dehydratase [bacterium (Candidatus Gribaldobacteria) CG_4_10_14_0_8_um_filter_33_9]
MRKKRILILGSTGMLGSMLTKYFCKLEKYEIYLSSRLKSFSYKNEIKFDPLISDIYSLPFMDYYINAIGIIKPHMLSSLEDSIYINSIFPRKLANYCESINTNLLQITTDCCFSGREGNYNEDSLHDALDEYGKSKSLGEPKNCMVLRTSIIGPELHKNVSLISWVLQQNNKTINGFINHFWNGITTLQYAKICEEIIDKNLYTKDLFHIFSPNIVSKYELVRLISEKYKINATINPAEAHERIDRTLSSKKTFCNDLKIPEIKRQVEEL